jgi:hypothetical protein
MGVNFRSSNGERFDAHFAYSTFANFRRDVAKEIGLDIYTMKGYYDLEGCMVEVKRPNMWGEQVETKEFDTALLEAEQARDRRSWDEIDDPIVPMLNASDIDGKMTAEECAAAAPRLRELMETWDDELSLKTEPIHQEIGYPEFMTIANPIKEQGVKLAEAMEWCAENGESLLFSG